MKSESSAPSAPPGKPCYIVDSWPVLEWLYEREPAVSLFQEHLDHAAAGLIRLVMSRINRGEIIYNAVIKLGLSRLNEIKAKVDALPIKIIGVEDWAVDAAVDLKILYPISYADCFVAVLAQLNNAAVITGDKDFLRLQSAGVLSVVWLGK